MLQFLPGLPKLSLGLRVNTIIGAQEQKPTLENFEGKISVVPGTRRETSPNPHVFPIRGNAKGRCFFLKRAIKRNEILLCLRNQNNTKKKKRQERRCERRQARKQVFKDLPQEGARVPLPIFCTFNFSC